MRIPRATQALDDSASYPPASAFRNEPPPGPPSGGQAPDVCDCCGRPARGTCIMHGTPLCGEWDCAVFHRGVTEYCPTLPLRPIITDPISSAFRMTRTEVISALLLATVVLGLFAGGIL